MEREHLESICKAILEYNQRPDHTVPAADLYPHQWLWDTCFVAIGVRHYDVKRSQREVLRLFDGQWANGMIPHMIFDPSKRYARDRRIWSSYVNPLSPDGVATSGITQPPVIAEAIKRIGEKLPKRQRISFYKSCLPALLGYHLWLMTERDPHGEGLVLQIHPWETGLDNAPPWMSQLHEHHKVWWIAMVGKLRLDGLVHFVRRDTRHVPPGQRTTNVEALMIFDMIRRFKRKAYDITKILHHSLFSIEDVGYNSILARNNSIICDLADAARVKLPEEFIEKSESQRSALQKCWDEQDGTFYSRDFITHQLIKDKTISCLLPLYSGVISPEQAARLRDILKDRRSFWPKHPVPSAPLNNPQFNSLRYWQGPTWINTNWLIIDGLARYGFDDDARELATKTIELVERHGPYEYFSPIDGEPLGAAEFSWSAALTIDLLARYPIEEPSEDQSN